MTLSPFRDAARGCFLTLLLTDKTGQIRGRIWEGADALAATLAEGQPVRVVAVAEDWQGQMQLQVQQATPVEDFQPTLFAEFVPSGTADIRKLKAQLEKAILSVGDAELSRLLRAIFSQRQFYEAYTNLPAAKQVHHAYLGGLLEHSLEVVEFCEAACRLFPVLNRDLLVTAALLHDIGKTQEYHVTGAIDMTDEGKLIGHVAIGLRLLDRALGMTPGFPREVADHLAHLLLSHHGELEHGAPILPQTIEAIALNLADLSSSKLKQFEQVLATCTAADWSAYDRYLGRSIYAGFGKVRAADGTPPDDRDLTGGGGEGAARAT
jgi:3'-5' exoribonuclease